MGVDISANELVHDRMLLRNLTFVVVLITLLLAALFGVVSIVIFKRESERIKLNLEIKNADLEESVLERTTELGAMVEFLTKKLKKCLEVVDTCLGSGGVSGDTEEIKRMSTSISKFAELFNLVALIRSGSLKVEKRMSDFQLMVKFVVKDFDLEIRNKNINVNVNVNSAIGVFSYDKNLVEKVVKRLMRNAIERNNVSNITLNVTTDIRKGQLLFELIDDGDKTQYRELADINNDSTEEDYLTSIWLIVIEGIIKVHDGKFGLENGEQNKAWFLIPLRFDSR